MLVPKDSPKLAPNSCDLIYIIDSYHHFEFPTDMLREISKALRPDGVLMLVDFKRIISAARIDSDALVAEKNERNPTPQGSAPKL